MAPEDKKFVFQKPSNQLTIQDLLKRKLKNKLDLEKEEQQEMQEDSELSIGHEDLLNNTLYSPAEQRRMKESLVCNLIK